MMIVFSELMTVSVYLRSLPRTPQVGVKDKSCLRRQESVLLSYLTKHSSQYQYRLAGLVYCVYVCERERERL